MKKKYKIKKISLIAAITILALFIILPPLLRITIKDVNLTGKAQVKQPKDNLTILSCTKFDPTTSYLITSRTRYNNEETDQNFITYEKTSQGNNPTSTLPSYKTPIEEITFFSSINGVEINSGDTKTTVLIPKYVVNMNESNFTLAKYFNNKEAQRKFYEEQGYTCKETKN